MRALSLIVLAVLLLLSAGCGRDRIVYQTRFVPSASAMVWRADHHELPWKPPALGETHYPRSSVGRYAPGGWPAETEFDHDDGVTEYRHARDGRPVNTRPDARY